MKNLVASLTILAVIAGTNVLASDGHELSNESSAINNNAQRILTGTTIGFNWPLGLSPENDSISVDYSHVMDGFNWPEGY